MITMSHPSTVVTSLLAQMTGVYRDSSRVRKDTIDLLQSPYGRHITAGTSALVQNDGTYLPSVLNLTGTLAMTYTGNTYHIPIEIFIPPLYPIAAPIVFVRPIANMIIQDRHPHVAMDGAVYIPYLTSWNTQSCNMVQCCSSMSVLFGLKPPLFTKPAVTTPVSSSVHSTVMEEMVRTEEDVVAREVEEANAAVQAARLADMEEERERNQLQQLRSNVTRKVDTVLKDFHKRYEELVVQEVASHRDLMIRFNYLQQHQSQYLQTRKQMLEQYNQDLSESIQRMQQFISTTEEEEKKRKELEHTNGVNIDLLATPADSYSNKLIVLTAQNSALSDTFYYLDKSLEAGAITLDKHLKTVRQLARRQFYIRAHLLKITKQGNT